jgi:predicted 2-oxoglutarate/Fe(II)-dependent dioxygenase YbiX
MEIDETKLNNYIKIYNNFLPKNIHKNYIKYVNSIEKFHPGKISGEVNEEQQIKKTIRDVLTFICKNSDEEKSFTNLHWTNFILHSFTNKIEDYFLNFNLSNKLKIHDLEILKYSIGGHYNLHSDNCYKFPRSLSFIYLINDDYEGGDLIFFSPVSNKEIKIKTEKNTLIIWPSNFYILMQLLLLLRE